MVKYSDDSKNRDLSIVKTCDFCKESYHPRKNSYQITSRFCSAECSRRGVRGVMQQSFGKKVSPDFTGDKKRKNP